MCEQRREREEESKRWFRFLAKIVDKRSLFDVACVNTPRGGDGDHEIRACEVNALDPFKSVSQPLNGTHEDDDVRGGERCVRDEGHLLIELSPASKAITNDGRRFEWIHSEVVAVWLLVWRSLESSQPSASDS